MQNATENMKKLKKRCSTLGCICYLIVCIFLSHIAVSPCQEVDQYDCADINQQYEWTGNVKQQVIDLFLTFPHEYEFHIFSWFGSPISSGTSREVDHLDQEDINQQFKWIGSE